MLKSRITIRSFLADVGPQATDMYLGAVSSTLHGFEM